MAKKHPIPLPHADLWQRLVNLRAARATAKNLEQDLICTRKELEDRLNQLGAKKTPEAQELSWNHWRTESEIEYTRNRLKTLADQMEKVIGAAADGLNEVGVQEFLAKLDQGEDEGDEDDDPNQMRLGEDAPAKPAEPPAQPPVELDQTIEAWAGDTGIALRFRERKMTRLQDVKDYLEEVQGDADAKVNSMIEYVGIPAATGEKLGAVLGFRVTPPRAPVMKLPPSKGGQGKPEKPGKKK